MNIAIAEVCGWDTDPVEAHPWISRGQWVIRPGDVKRELYSKIMSLPKYCSDLNAMADVVQTLDEYQRASFECRLVEIVTDGVFDMKKHPVSEMHYVDALSAMHATAKQRAEAFLRTLGKWIE